MRARGNCCGSALSTAWVGFCSKQSLPWCRRSACAVLQADCSRVYVCETILPSPWWVWQPPARSKQDPRMEQVENAAQTICSRCCLSLGAFRPFWRAKFSFLPPVVLGVPCDARTCLYQWFYLPGGLPGILCQPAIYEWFGEWLCSGYGLRKWLESIYPGVHLLPSPFSDLLQQLLHTRRHFRCDCTGRVCLLAQSTL